MHLKAGLACGLLLMVGCASFSQSAVKTPKNATLKTEDGPFIQAHRGGRSEHDDNGVVGFARSLACGLRGFETDVRFSKDHELVLMHDPRADRTTNGKGRVEDLTFDELRQFRLRSCSEPVPAVEEILQVLSGRDDIFIEIEMKAYPDKFYTPEVLAEFCNKLYETTKDFLLPGTYAFTCSNVKTLETMRAIDPDVPLGFIVPTKLTREHIAAAKRLKCCSLAPMLAAPTELLDEAHKAGMTVCLWMVQNATHYAEAKAKGADRVTSDYPHLLYDAIRGIHKKGIIIGLDVKLDAQYEVASKRNQEALKALEKKYDCLSVSTATNKYEATMAWAKGRGYTLSDIVYIGEDFSDGGSDSMIRIKGIDHIIVHDKRDFINSVGVLLK